MSCDAVPGDVADALFLDAPSAVEFGDDPVGLETLRRIHALARMCPTAHNVQPLRMVVVRSADARARLVDAMTPHNRSRVRGAGTCLILSADNDFHLPLAEIAATADDVVDAYASCDHRPDVARFNAAIQVGYLLPAVRAVGLAATPMQGFDLERVQRDFFPGRDVTPLLVVGIGRRSGVRRPRRPRLDFDAVVDIV